MDKISDEARERAIEKICKVITEMPPVVGVDSDGQAHGNGCPFCNEYTKYLCPSMARIPHKKTCIYFTALDLLRGQ